MSESAGRACAWLLLDRGKPWSVWLNQEIAQEKDSAYGPPEGLVPLVPEQLLVEAETAFTASLITIGNQDEQIATLTEKLQAVLALADEWVAASHRDDYRRAVHECARELRALTQTPTEAVKK